MLTVLLGTIVRLSVSLHPYSGQSSPPMYGDYEAQRHWMEVTYNLPLKEWYFNTTNNDLMYWGLDYPPLTAYHSWLCGYLGAALNTSYMELHKSRGYENERHKLFMRLTVLVADLLTFIPAVYFIFSDKFVHSQIRKEGSKPDIEKIGPLSCFLALIYPGLIIIDHGHFQYNCISLGMFVFSVLAILRNSHLTASVLFCVALTYKQMELYHAIPYFCYLLGVCFTIYKDHGVATALLKLSLISIVVLFTFTIICFPFITTYDQLFQLTKRLFPLARGVFEDKVANIWCALNIIYKLKTIFTNEVMAKLCLCLTLLTVLPSSYNLLKYPSVTTFQFALINSSLSFFLFSFQVHEKSILLVAIPVMLLFPYDPFPCFWFLCISTFSMLPLIIKDQLIIPYISLSIFYIVVFLSSSFMEHYKFIYNFPVRAVKLSKNRFLIKMTKYVNYQYIFYLSLMICVFLTFSICLVDPPKRYPDLFPVVISVYSFFHFLWFFVYFNVKQWNCIHSKIKQQ